jgi:hypothetical protein
MSQKFKNSRQKAQRNSGAIFKLFNALFFNFCYNRMAVANFSI